MGQDFHAAFPTDYYGVKTTELPILGNIHSLRDVHYVISLSVGFPGLDTWYVYGKEKYGFELGWGCTAVSAPRFYPLLNTGQINGLLGGLRGAAEYEILLGKEGKAVAGMDAESATHFLIILLIVVCNGVYFLTGQEGGERRQWSTETLLGAWVAVGFSLCIYSFLYKDNPFFKLGEHIFVGGVDGLPTPPSHIMK